MEQARLTGGFWRFWGATFLANIGDGIRLAAFPLLAASLTDDPLAVATVAAAQFLPWLLFGLMAGSWADRFPSRRLLVAADALRTVVLGVLVAGIALGWAGIALVVAVPELWAAVAVTVITSGGFALFNVAALSLRHRSVPEGLVGRVTAAGRVVTLSSAGVGTLLGGWVAGAIDLATPFLFSGVLAVVALAWWWTASRPAGPAPSAA